MTSQDLIPQDQRFAEMVVPPGAIIQSMAPENMNPQDYPNGFPADLSELKAFVSEVPVYNIMPELEIEPASCNCCWDWCFTHQQQRWIGSAYAGGHTAIELWELLWSLVNRDTDSDAHFIRVGGDQSAFCLGVEKTADEKVYGWFYEADEGNSSTPPVRLAFCCPAINFVTQLSRAMGYYARAYPTDGTKDLEYHNSHFEIYATMKYWPWNAFPIWYQLKDKFPSWQAYWLTFVTLAKASVVNFMPEDDKEPFEHLIFQYHWNTFLFSLLKKAGLYCETLLISAFEHMQQTYTTQLNDIHNFLDALDGHWEKGEWFHNGSDGEYLNYCIEHPEYALLSCQKHLANLRWWQEHMIYSFRRCVPELYDWQQRKSWEDQLEKNHPEVYTALNWRWRQNRIWQASFETGS